MSSIVKVKKIKNTVFEESEKEIILSEEEFNICERLYNKNNDLNTLYNNPNGIKYLMIRSFIKDDLVQLSNLNEKKINIDKLRIEVFINININKIIKYILSKKNSLSIKYIKELSIELSKMCVESSSVHHDDFNTNMNKIIRNLEISSYLKLKDEIENKLIKQLTNYTVECQI